MASALVLKIKAGSEQSVLRDLTSSSTLSELAQKVCSFSGWFKCSSPLPLLYQFPNPG
jgi:hypothetical protein